MRTFEQLNTHLSEQKITNSTHTPLIQQGIRQHNVAEAFGHFDPIDRPVRVRDQSFWRGEADRQQEGRPIDGMKTQDILTSERLDLIG